MTGFLLLARREVVARRLVFAGSIALGLAAAATPWLAGTRGELAVDVRSAATLVTAAIWCFLLAVGSGVTAWASDLNEGRLAFDYRLPVSALAIWLARFGVAVFSIFAAGGLVVLVAAPFGVDLATGFEAVDFVVARWLREPADAIVAAGVALFLVPLIVVGAHFLGMIPRASRGWTLGALAAVVAAKLGLARIATSVAHFDGRATGWWLTGLAIEVAVACGLVATLVQAAHGRSELDVSHRVLSLGLVVTAGLLIAGGLVWRWHYVHAKPSGLTGAYLEVHPLDERRVAVAGWDGVRGRKAAFVIEPGSGQWRDLGPVASPFSEEVLRRSVDGTVAWYAREPGGGYRLLVLPPGPQDREPRRTALFSRDLSTMWAVAPGGDLVALLSTDGEVVATSTEDGSARWLSGLPGCFRFVGMRFLSPETLAAFCDSRQERNGTYSLLRYEFDVVSGDMLATRPSEEEERQLRLGRFSASQLDELLADKSHGPYRPDSPHWLDRSSGEWIPVLPHLEP